MKRRRKIDPIVQELAQRLREEFGERIQRIILYGSRARGDAAPDSDYDVIVLVDQQTEGLEERIEEVKYDVAWQYDAVIVVLVYETSYFKRKEYEPLFMNVRREGILL